ncbi:2-C-methyl-D-erythritol 2,4-cyclodiphosphate synthase [Clostridia bacterium]|nr:2-C-methyl-D-erythritol 2,4-cyclodiphosphate synthase [Clostridia bacterium]
MRIGHGYDAHKLVEGRKLILGGVEIPYNLGLLGHSDADVLTHAVMDALLGAAALGDIGQMFPDSDNQYKNANSLKMLKAVTNRLANQGFKINNIDATIIAQAPKLAIYIPKMQENIAQVTNAKPSQISIKATTEEHMGFTGRNEGISAHCVTTIDNEQ